MKKTTKLIALLLVVAMLLGTIGCAAQTETEEETATSAPAEEVTTEETTEEAAVVDDTVYEFRCSTNLAATSTVGLALAKFVELLNEESGGRIEATANYGSELGSQAEQVEMCRLGDLEMVVAAPGTGPGTYVPQLMMFEFPFLFDDNDQYRRVLDAMEDEVSSLVEPYGFIAMAGQSQGSRDILTVKPVTCVEDMEGLVMRGPNAVYISMFEALGASGITMDWNEIYTALSTGVCDGCEGSPSSLYASSFQDNAKYLAITNHIIACVYYFFNADWYNAMPEDLQALIRECADEAEAYQEQIDDEDQGVALEAMIADGVTVTEMTDIDAWKEKCAPLLDEYRAKGEEWSDFIDKLLAID